MRESLVPVPKHEPGFLIQEGKKLQRKQRERLETTIYHLSDTREADKIPKTLG